MFQFPIFVIESIKPLLRKDEKVFAYEIKALTEKADMITMYENKGLDLSKYIGIKMECLVEITRGRFIYKEEFDKKQKNILSFQYQWQKRLYEYFPELVKISDDLDEANTDKEIFIRELFEATATKTFKEWGLNGLELGIYQDKPLFSGKNGFFLLNEFEFGDDIEELELNQKVYIQIDELYMRGIRPYLPNGKEYKREAQKEELKQKETEQEEIPKEPKISRFSFLA